MQGSVVLLVKTWKIATKKSFLGQSTSIAEVIAFWVMHYRVQHFFHNVGLMGIKRHRILRRFQKYKLTLVTKCT
jgi:hypothetical protein